MTISLTLKRFIEAPARDVWAVLTELSGWTYWAGVGPVTLERPGLGGPNGVGAIRVIAVAGIRVREEITALEPCARIGYRLLSGAPVEGHAGVIVLDERPHGTVVRWTVTFRPRVPGTGRALRLALRVALGHVLQRLDNRMAPLERHQSECPYADTPPRLGRLGLPGRREWRRALLQARLE